MHEAILRSPMQLIRNVRNLCSDPLEMPGRGQGTDHGQAGSNFCPQKRASGRSMVMSSKPTSGPLGSTSGLPIIRAKFRSPLDPLIWPPFGSKFQMLIVRHAGPAIAPSILISDKREELVRIDPIMVSTRRYQNDRFRCSPPDSGYGKATAVRHHQAS
jgi:hypothetical protein